MDRLQPPEDEKERLAAVEALNLLDSDPEERFDRVTRLVRSHFRVSIAAVTLLDHDRLWLKSRQGPLETDIPRHESFCDHTIHQKALLEVEDALKDTRFRRFLAVRERPYVRFYAGCPLRTPEGYPVGTLCILDTRPRLLSVEERRELSDFAAIVEDELSVVRLSRTQRELISQLRQYRLKALVDPLTQCWNRGAVMDILEREILRSERNREPLSISLLDLDHFKRVNDEHGHQAGDEVLKECVERTRRQCRAYDSLGRYGGEEFLLILPGCDLEQAEKQAERVRLAMASDPLVVDGRELTVTCSLGVTVYRQNDGQKEMIERADRALYRAKQNGRNRVENEV